MQYSLIQLKKIPQHPGIYKFLSSNDVILYVGKAKDLKKRVTSYFTDKKKDGKKSLLVGQIQTIEIIGVSSEFEALLLEAKLIKEYQPKYNVIWKDDKHYLYIKITKEELPRILFARKENLDGNYFGPFTSATVVKELLRFLRTIFPYCSQKSNSSRGCFYTHLGLCNPCPSEINKTSGSRYKELKRQYKNNIRNIKMILQGKIKNVRRFLTRQMMDLSKDEKFEAAAGIRNRIKSLDYLVNQYAPVDSYIEDPGHLKKIYAAEQKELLKHLSPYFPKLKRAKHMECYDISNISGKLATGSMVTFMNNQPHKNLYRRFRIRFKKSPDDFAMLREAMDRRLKHKEWKLPDIMVIDGGQPQLLALQKVLNMFDINIPMIGLAKDYEEIVIPQKTKFIKLKLVENSPALHLVKRIRDEAHRFAHKYHSLLRLKHLLPEVSS